MSHWIARIQRLGMLGVMLAAALAACGRPTPTPSPPPPLPTATSTITPTPTATPLPTIPCHASPPGVSAAREAQDYLTPYDHILGDARTASVFLVVYSDFQCTPCATLAPILRQVQAAHSQDVALVYRHYPLLNLHDKAALAAQAAEAAARQGKFWPMHDLLFAEQSQWVGMDGKAFGEYLREAAARLGMDAERFAQDLQSEAIVSMVQRAWENGIAHNLPAVPLLYINAQYYNGPLDLDDLDEVVRLQILAQRQFHTCPPMPLGADDEVEARLLTSQGTVRLQLFPDQAPQAVNSFAFLAAHDWYDNNPILETTADYVRTGDPSGTGYGNAGYTFGLELAADLRFDRVGQVALFNSGGASNSSQFFITLRALPAYDGHATIFGTVTQGMDVVRRLQPEDRLLDVQIFVNGAPWP